MPKSRHSARKKDLNSRLDSSGGRDANDPAFVVSGEETALLTLLFDNKQAQHEALSRIEAFYESNLESKKYLSLEAARDAQVCQHYEAYNFPLSAVRQWLDCMHQIHLSGLSSQTEPNLVKDEEALKERHWWESHCNTQEVHLLKLFESLDILSSASPSSPEELCSTTPIYLISTLSSKQSSLYHERLHFLYYISSDYRRKVEFEYRSLSSRALKVIQQDLAMRNYSEHVWMDEFQAYVSENAGEFGLSIQEECQEIKATLNRFQRELWRVS